MPTIQDREEWLNKAARAVVALVLTRQVPRSAPALTDLRISCGFPRGARKGRSQTMPRALSKDGTSEVFINPELDDPAQVLPVLTECLIQAAHDAAGWAKGQRAYSDAKAIGLKDPLNGEVSEELAATFQRIAQTLGTYPHARVFAGKREATRQLKLQCNRCAAVWRASAKWAVHMSACPCCHSGDIVKPV